MCDQKVSLPQVKEDGVLCVIGSDLVQHHGGHLALGLIAVFRGDACLNRGVSHSGRGGGAGCGAVDRAKGGRTTGRGTSAGGETGEAFSLLLAISEDSRARSELKLNRECVLSLSGVFGELFLHLIALGHAAGHLIDTGLLIQRKQQAVQAQRRVML